MARSRKQAHGPIPDHVKLGTANDSRLTRQYAGSLKHHDMLIERDSERVARRKSALKAKGGRKGKKA